MVAKWCEEKSEIIVYYCNFQRMFAVTKQMIAADRDGNWSLHVAAVQVFLSILRSFDAINYVHHGTQIHPPRPLSSVAGDMKLEQTHSALRQ